MNILLAGQAYYRRDNGQAVFTINLAEGLAATGHDVTVLAPSDSGTASLTTTHGVQVQTVPALALIDNTNITAFSGSLVEETISANKPDVVHIQDHYFLSHTVLSAAKNRGILAVGTNHFLPENLTDNLPFSQWLHKPLDYLLWSAMLAVYNQLSAVSTPTETAAAILRSQRIHVPVTAISCGVELERFHPRPTLDRLEIRQKYKIAADKLIFLYVGRIDREKDLDVLLRGWSQVTGGNIQLVLAGKGGFRPELEKMVEEYGLGDSVIFAGFVPDEDLPFLLNSADIFAMPSHAELQSIATLEAMASGLPILAADARALPELVKPGINGYLFSAGNAFDVARKIRTLISHPEQWPAMSHANQQKASLHAHNKIVEQYTEWYKQAALGTLLHPAWSGIFQAVDV
ncbi:MAG: glycosyltransferase [Caldilineaceae bacterium]